MNRIITQLGQSKAILVFIMILGLVIGYLNYVNTDALVLEDETVLISRKGDSLESWENFNLDFSILDDETYKSLEIFGENPVNPGITGERKNPFLPF
jgi:hypothetical protein